MNRHTSLPAIVMSLMSALALTTSCIRDEEPNAEADIESVTLHVPNPERFFFAAADSFKNVPSSDTIIRFDVREGVDLTSIAPELKITSGARVTPQSGEAQNFADGPVAYIVRGESGQYTRTYQIVFRQIHVDTIPAEADIIYSFEASKLDPQTERYYVWTEPQGIPDTMCWASGNPGFRLSKSTALPDEYPTVAIENGYQGRGVKLVTRSTMPFGGMVNMRMAAGNLFIGTFDVTNALRDAMAATCFGMPFTMQPLRFSGYYQYTPGETYQNRAGQTVADSIDRPDIYAVLYRNVDSQGNPVVLNGADVLTNPNIVALAQLKYQGPTTGWTHFEEPFVYRQTLNPQVLAQRGYNLTVVASSSKEGASFCGAVGSTLLIDEFHIVCKNSQDEQ